MADETDAYPGNTTFGTEAARSLFFRDMKLTIREENEKTRGEFSKQLADLEQKITTAQIANGEKAKRDLDELEDRIVKSRPADVVEGLRVWSGSEESDMADLKSFLKRGIAAKRIRAERKAEVMSYTTTLVRDFILHAMLAGMLSGAAYMGWTWLK